MKQKMDFSARKGEWALIVGASTGLGKAWAAECAKKGFNTVICSRRLEKLQEVSSELGGKYGVETKEFVCDITAEDAPDIIMEAVKDLDITVCVYNAAVETGGYFIKVDEKYHRQQLMGNARNPMILAHRVLRNMAKKHRGYLLLVSSMAGVVGTANQASYGGCKSLMALLGEALWYEMAKYGVYAANVTVGSVATPNFTEQQAKQGTDMQSEQTYTLPDFGIDISELEPAAFSAVPHTPECVAAYVMSHIGEGPRLFTHPEDEAAYYALMKARRETGVTVMSKMTDMYFSAFTAFDSEDADTFTEIDEK